MTGKEEFEGLKVVKKSDESFNFLYSGDVRNIPLYIRAVIDGFFDMDKELGNDPNEMLSLIEELTFEAYERIEE